MKNKQSIMKFAKILSVALAFVFTMGSTALQAELMPTCGIPGCKIHLPKAPEPKWSIGQCETGHYTLTKKVLADATVGQDLEYTLNLFVKTNVTDVVVSDVIPANASYVSGTPSAKVSGKNMSWDLGTLKEGDTKEIKYVLRADSTGTLAECATVTMTPHACTTTVIGEAVIGITKTNPTPRVNVGETVPFEITVSNTGNRTAENVVVTDKVPSGLTSVEGSSSLRFDVGSLAPGATRSIAVPLKATERGTFENCATVTTSNAGTATDCASVVVTKPQVSITKTGTDSQFIGKQADYTITVKNEGDTTLENLTVTDVAASPMRILSASGANLSGNTATWTISSLGAGATKTFSVSTTSASAGTYQNCATVSVPADGLRDEDCQPTEWKGFAALLLEVIDTEDPLLSGEQTSYIIRVTNQGSAADKDIVITAAFPAEISPLSASGATKGTINGSKVSFAPVAALQPKQSVEFSIQAKAQSIGDARLKVQLKSELLKTPVTEEESTQVF